MNPMQKYGIWFILFLTLFLGASFTAAFTTFFITPESSNFTLASLETASSNITISFNALVTPEEGEDQPYRIERSVVCEEYDEDWNCIEAPPNLCPYLAIQPNDGESTETGYPLDASFPWATAEGELLAPTDQTDSWTLSITSPCFEGECPANYDAWTNGDPLPQSLKNQTFKCNLNVDWNGGVFPVRALTNTALAATTNMMTVEAVFTGGGVQQIDPVIIIPGIMGSATKNGELVIDPILHSYDDLIETLDQNGYEKEVDLFTFPYEWRDPNSVSANLLKNKIAEVKDICDCNKVDLVAHSMGGLVAREYIQSAQYQNDVDQVIFLGTPHRGSPKAYLQWEAGEFPAGSLSSLIKLKFQHEAITNLYPSLFGYIHGRPVSSVQELLPVFDYLKDKDTGTVRPYSNGYPRNVFLEALNTNTGIQALLNSGVESTNIVGNVGAASTIERVRVVAPSNPLWTHGKPDGFDNKDSDQGLEYGSGDGTVTILGATLANSVPNQISQAEHLQLPSVEENNIFNLLTNKDSSTNIHRSLISKILNISLHSPIDIVVVAPDGKKIGKNFATGQEYNEIPDAFYSGFNNDDDEYITIPNPIDGEYKIELQGTGSGGKYGVLTSYISDSFATTTETTGITAPNQITILEVIIDNDNPEQLDAEREVTLDVLVVDINGAYNLGWITDKKTRDGLILEAKLIIKFEKKKNGKLEKKVDKILIKVVEKELDMLLKKGKINAQASDLLKTDLKYIINNN